MSSRGLCLITGGALGDIPIIKEAKNLGFRVITSGNRPFDIGHQFSDEFVESDYTDVVELTNICVSRNIDVLISSCHDLAYISAAKVAYKLGFPGYDTPENAEILHSKNLLRATLRELGIRTPNFADCKSLEEAFRALDNMPFPLIVKPVDLTGGNGISICKDRYSFERAFLKAFTASKQNRVIVEEFLEGKYHGFSSLVSQGRIASYFLDDEFYLPNTFRVSATSFPSQMNLVNVEKLVQDLQLIVDSLKLVDGLLHVQFIETSEGPVIIEIMRRTPGDLYPVFVQISTSINYAKSILLPYLRQFYTSEDLVTKMAAENSSAFVLRYMLMAKSRGVIEQFDFDHAISLTASLNSSFYTKQVGDFIDNPRTETCSIMFYVSTHIDQNPTLLFDKVFRYSNVKMSATNLS